MTTPAGAPRSALLVPVPEAEPVVGALRAAHAPEAADGIPAHVTLLVPFLEPERIDDDVHARLTEVFAAGSSFDFVLARLGRFPSTSYLVPDPAAPFVALTEALTRAFPPLLPYGGAFDEVIPHLTIGDYIDEQTRDRIEALVSPRLPLRARAGVVWLMTRPAPHGAWSLGREYALGAAGVDPAR